MVPRSVDYAPLRLGCRQQGVISADKQGRRERPHFAAVAFDQSTRIHVQRGH
jgi:hypothetical protein